MASSGINPTNSNGIYARAEETAYVAAEQLHRVFNGTAEEEVMADDGLIPSIRKALVDNFYFLDPIAWEVDVTESVFNQPRVFTNPTAPEDVTYWFAPAATSKQLIPMGGSPFGDDNWQPWINGFDKGNPLISWAYTAETMGQTVIHVPFKFKVVGNVFINGVHQNPDESYEYDKKQRAVTLSQALDLGDTIVIQFGMHGGVVPSLISQLERIKAGAEAAELAAQQEADRAELAASNAADEFSQQFQDRFNTLAPIPWTPNTLIKENQSLQVFEYNGLFYLPNVKKLPFTTGAVFNADNWILSGLLTANTSFLSKYEVFARSLYERLTMQYIDAEAYIVKVGGIIDWSATVQAALNTGRNVRIGTGGVTFNRTVTFKNQHILGAGCVPVPTSGTIVNVSGNFPAFKYDTAAGYTSGGSIKGVFIDYGEKKAGASHTQKMGIDFGSVGDAAWASAFELQDVIVRGGYYGYFDGTGTYLVKYKNCWAEQCWTGFYKQAGTTITYDTCYALRCHRAWGVSFTHVVTFINCAYDGSDTEQFDQAFHLNGCKGVTITGIQHEFSAINRPDTTDFLVENSSGVVINGVNFITPDVTTAAGTVYVMEIRNSIASISGLTMGTGTSAGAGVYAVIATRGSKVSVKASDIGAWSGASVNVSLTADATSTINYESVTASGLISGDCRENGSFGGAIFTLSSLIVPAQTQITVGQKSIEGLKITDYILSTPTSDTGGAVISSVWDGDGIVKLTLYNPRNAPLTLTGDIIIRTLRF